MGTMVVQEVVVIFAEVPSVCEIPCKYRQVPELRSVATIAR